MFVGKCMIRALRSSEMSLPAGDALFRAPLLTAAVEERDGQRRPPG